MASEQFAMGPNGIGIGNNGAHADRFALGRFDGHHTVFGKANSGNEGSIAESDAKILGEFLECFGHGAGAAARIPDALAGLHMRDAAQDSGRSVRGRADVLGEVIQHLRDARIFDETTQSTADCAPHAHAENIFEGAGSREIARVEHVPEAANGPPEEIPLRDVIEAF